jgi:uncharacterized protein (DUF924 family)
MWFKKSDEFDELIRNKFNETIEICLKAKIDEIFISAENYLSYIIVLDQFTRNAFRNNYRSFYGDEKALKLSKIAIKNNFLVDNNYYYNSFFLMPFMHSENIVDHQLGLPLFQKFTNENTFKHALKHKKVIEKFSRFPHRNEILARKSSKSELEFLKLPGSRF